MPSSNQDTTMLTFEEAYKIVMDQIRVLDSEPVSLPQALGRVLAEDMQSDMNMPPFNKSSMDGYACRRKDLSTSMRLLEVIQAGMAPTQAINSGTCSKIMTGAPVPEGADCVFMVEHSEEGDDGMVRFTGNKTGDNICRLGEDVKDGDTVLHRGDWIAPQHVAVLASVGCTAPSVARRPKVAIIATGDELVEPEEKPSPSQIRSSNGYQLQAQVVAAGAEAHYYGIAGDNLANLDRILKTALAENDVVMLSGGVSMGDFDLVPGVMLQNNVNNLFDSIAMKPGKPLTFGVTPKAWCFGMPGNPVSTFVQFEILVKPFLQGLMGHTPPPTMLKLPAAGDFKRKKIARESWIPVVLTEEGAVRQLEYHGSAHLNALCGAQGFAVIPAHAEAIAADELVHVRLL
jgi:molybdopterin molybdotransferase